MKEVLKKYKVVWIAIVFSLLVEVFVCNYGFWRSLLGGNRQEDVVYTIEENKVKIENINQRVTSINFRYPKPVSQLVTYKVKVVTEDRVALTEMKTKTILPGNRHYVLLDTHADCKSMEIEIIGGGMGLEKIQINQPIFYFNVFRVILLFLGALLLLKVKEGSVGQKEYDENSKKQKIWDICALTAICLLLGIYTTIQIRPVKFLLAPNEIGMSSAGGSIDCVTMQVEAFVNGQVALLVEPSEELKNLSNPYDISLREKEKVSALYDTAYHNGKYYNYFGVAPILTSILPFRLLTGKYLPLYIFNLIYISIAIFALYALYRKLIQRFVGKVSCLHFWLGLITILVASNLLILVRGLKYDIAVTSGIAFILLALNLAISIQKETKARALKLVLLGISTGLVVLSKPSFICYYLLILFFFWNSIQNLDKKEKLKSIIIPMVPLVLLAILQMTLNYLRFDNIFEFGAKYQLSLGDVRVDMRITFGKILEGFFLYLGKMPLINPLQFPFVSLMPNYDFWEMNEKCLTQPLIGLVYIPILFVYLFAKEILKNPKEKEFKHFIWLVLFLTVVLIILNTCYGGIIEEYTIDFKLMLAVGAVLLILKVMEQKQGKGWVKKAFYIVCLATILIMLPIGLFANCRDWGKQPISIFVENTFEFWK